MHLLSAEQVEATGESGGGDGFFDSGGEVGGDEASAEELGCRSMRGGGW